MTPDFLATGEARARSARIGICSAAATIARRS
jgi:hypothetical protein